ncbi:MAG: hypothetical protein LC802_07425, partial [Acidobacteria bacterium]|nr:hypothetical protein [Acidobacteriota bacterium]
VFLDKNTCAGCASQLRLYQNGSDAAGATLEDKVRDVLVDDNIGPLDLLAGFTNASAITLVAAGLPAQPSAAQNLDIQPDPETPTSSVSQMTAPPVNDVTAAPLVSVPRVTKPAKAEAQSPTQVAAAAAAQAAPVEAEQPPVSKTDVGSAKNSPAAPSSSSKTSPVVVSGSGGTVSIIIGTLNAGDSVTITFQVVVDNPYSGGPNVSNQGQVSGTNFTTVNGGTSTSVPNTDDPDVAGTNNPTLTPILSTHIRVNDAKVAEPASGTSQMLFTVTLSAPAGAGGVTVNYSTANGTAIGGGACGGSVDYENAAGILTFAAGERVRTIPVNVCADTDSPETNETFLMNISGASSGTIDDPQAVGTITQGNDPGTFLISELRTSGPGGSADDFVELYNNTVSPLTIAASDASGGYGVYKMGADCSVAPVLVGTIPNGTVIPARGHYLLVGTGYSLANYGGTGAAAGNLTLTSDIETDHNVAVFTTADVNAISTETRLDAVGFGSNTGGAVCDLLREGSNLPPIAAASTTEHSFFRKMETGFPQDTNDNGADFRFADTQGTFISGVPQQLGAPGPENLSSPIVRTSTVKSSLLDSTVPSSASPNRVRDFTSNPGNNSTFGTLSIRRRFTNNTGANVTRLRFRIVDVTTFPSPGGGQADVRAITSTNVSVSGINDPTTCSAAGAGSPPCTVTVRGTTLEQPPAQPNGGGYNSTLSAGTVTLATPLAPSSSINVQFLLGLQTTGSFRFFIIVEALP